MTQIKNRTLPEERPAGRQPRGKTSLGSWSTFSNSCIWWDPGNETSWGLVSEGEQTHHVDNMKHLHEHIAGVYSGKASAENSSTDVQHSALGTLT